MIDLSDIIARVEKASGPDRVLDAEIDAAMNGGRASHTFTDERYSAALLACNRILKLVSDFRAAEPRP